MLLTIFTNHSPATDLGYLLHKHPDRMQSFDLSFGQAHVFYPEANENRCEACLLLDVDPVGMIRGKRREGNDSFLLGQYVNDRPYVASSFMSVAIAQVFGSAMNGRCKDRPELVDTPLQLTVQLEVLPVRGGEVFLHRIFEPLGYTVEVTRHRLDDRFPELGESSYFSVTISGTKKLSELLSHLYVLIPVFDNDKHYFVGSDEVEKLLAKGEGWLAAHPEKDQISRRYLRHQTSLYRQALTRLIEVEQADPESVVTAGPPQPEESLEQSLSLNDQRLACVATALRACEARKVLDLGCGEGKLLRELLRDRQFEEIVGMDVSIRALELAQKRLKLDRLPERQAMRLKLIHGSLMYRDKRLEGFDAAAVVEVIEHLDPPRLASFERVVFEFARPTTVVITTPNCEYNVMWETLPPGQFRHSDHRFEWTRQEFQDWANRVAGLYGYSVHFHSVGPEDSVVGSPTQMAIFEQSASEHLVTDHS